MREINQAGLKLIKSFEGARAGTAPTPHLHPYLDPVAIWTIGWGHAIVVGGAFLRGPENRARAKALYPDGLTPAQADALLRADLLQTCRDVSVAIAVPTADNQYAALVSFTFNLGIGNLRRSTLLRLVNQSDFDGATAEFPRWNKAGGKVLQGLVRRRAAEAELFRK